MRQIKFLSFVIMAVLSMFTIVSCGEDDPIAPTVTLSNDSFEGKTGETATTTVNATLDSEFKELRIIKYLGTDIDDSYGTNGTLTVTSTLPYQLSYDLNEEGANTPVRFQFIVEDIEGLTGEANFVITTELTLEFVLTNFDWRLDSKLGKLFDESEPESEQIVECEKDNVFTFNEDGTMSIDYGPLTGSGGGSCDFDGLNPYVMYEISNNGETLTMTLDNIFDPGNFSTEVYTVQSFSTTELVTTIPIDLTAFGGILYDWTYIFKAQAK